MNNKRQTIWLVSMLSLMVILSAYYLFTEDAPTNSTGTEATQLLDETGKAAASSNPEGVTVTEEEPLTDELAGVNSDGTSGGIASGEGSKGTAPDDETVLKGINNATGHELIDKIALEEQIKISKLSEELYAKIASNSKVSQEEATSAAEELDRLEDKDLRITSLQEKLLQEYDNAVVSEVDTNFKVIVLSDKLEKKQAIGIIDLATKELNVTPDRVTVQYVK
ncbi:SpoIIIAH-like family protein [Cohnella cholangitidis]|uniref:SpoIIIAH-like family protein n=1 Tax=Cohnella cholangitidis TaxID=2598458 RepID=A0A7G5C4W3_9BACL|nr:SpoIIIAH-like family protein [Cohnella cholangitidis]QMV44247.1 SpoIIIAH-like family protein [Cohnella cholangitidis]